MTSLDRRRHAYREDLAASALRDIVSAPRYVDPQPMQVRVANAPLRRAPKVTLGYETELIAGEIFDVYDRAEGFAWGQARRDGYVGYCPKRRLGRSCRLRHIAWPTCAPSSIPPRA